MGYEKYPRGDYYGRREHRDERRDYGDGSGPGRSSYSDDRDYATAGNFDRDRDFWGGGSDSDRDSGGYGQREGWQREFGRQSYRQQGYGQRDHSTRQSGSRSYGPQEYGHGRYGDRERQQDGSSYGPQRYGQSQSGGYGRGYQGEGRQYDSFGRGGRHQGDDERQRDERFRNAAGGWSGGNRQGHPRDRNTPRDYDYDDRGFFARAGDEVRSWFGDDEAERRREADMRYDERAYNDRDSDYHNWRSSQIAALDRDYDEYRRENRSKFENEFSTWRSGRQAQRDSLARVEEHMEVVGADGSHVGTVDKVRGDRILLTKNDADAEGHHHSIPSGWIASVDAKVTLSKTADEAKRRWRDEEHNQAMFGDDDRTAGRDTGASGGDAQGRMLNRSFPGTY